MAQWSIATADLLGTYLVPGRNFVLTRDLLVYPVGGFIEAGLTGLCGLAMYPRKKGAFLDLTYMPSGFLDSVSEDAMYEWTGYDEYKISLVNNMLRVRDYVCHLFGKPGRETKTGVKYVTNCVTRGRMADPSFFT